MKRRGAILVMTLAVLTAVIAVLAGAAAMQQLAFKAAINRTDRERARLMAESGLQRALTSLASQNPNATTQNDEWFTLGTNGNDKFLLDDGSFRLQIVDANSLVNLNTAAQEQLLRLPLTEEQVESLLDWRTAGIPAQIARNIITQRNRVRTFATIGDVLRVQGITTRNASTIIDSLIVNNNTPTGKLDLNTVTESILNTIPNLPPDAIQGILQRQPQAGFRSVGELANVPGVTMSVLQQTADLFTTGSRSFIVRVVGAAGSATIPLEAVVTIGASSAPATASTV